MPKRALVITAVLVTTSALVPPLKVKASTEPPSPPVPALDETLASLELPSRPPAPDPAPPVAVDPPGVMVGEPTSARGQGPARGRTAANRPGRTSRSGDPLARIRACESGSNYQARSASGRYGGAYQMDRATFASVGGSGDPAAASPAEQDRRARILYQQRGGRPWPACAGRT